MRVSCAMEGKRGPLRRLRAREGRIALRRKTLRPFRVPLPWAEGEQASYAALSASSLSHARDHGFEGCHSLAELFIFVAGERGHLLDRLEFLA